MKTTMRFFTKQKKHKASNETMSDAANKKRKADEPAVNLNWFYELKKREEARDAVESAWLREFVGTFIFDAPSFTMDGKMNWSKFWAPLRMPQNIDELPDFLAAVASKHQARHYGSYELQILLHALNSHGHAYAFRVQIDAALRKRDVSAALMEQIRRALMGDEKFVHFVMKTGQCCDECKQPRFEPKLRYFSFKEEYN